MCETAPSCVFCKIDVLYIVPFLQNRGDSVTTSIKTANFLLGGSNTGYGGPGTFVILVHFLEPLGLVRAIE